MEQDEYKHNDTKKVVHYILCVDEIENNLSD